VLRQTAAEGDQLPQEEVWSLESAPTEEEDKVKVLRLWSCGDVVQRREDGDGETRQQHWAMLWNALYRC